MTRSRSWNSGRTGETETGLKWNILKIGLTKYLDDFIVFYIETHSKCIKYLF